MSMDFRGDPSAALLEVLDPEQNHTFNDHYLDLDYDLSRVMFVCTANVLLADPAAAPGPHGDHPAPRLHREREALDRARSSWCRSSARRTASTSEHIEFSDAAILEIIRHYTRESGVRSLEREIASVCRKVAREVVKAGAERDAREDHAAEGEEAARRAEVPLRPGRGGRPGRRLHGPRLHRGGRRAAPDRGLGDAGQGQAPGHRPARRGDAGVGATPRCPTCARAPSSSGSRATSTRRSTSTSTCPRAPRPKDGPSAGITIATAIASALTRVPIRSDVAMTGEITLRGRVLPIGGLKEKMIAAHARRHRHGADPEGEREGPRGDPAARSGAGCAS